jgi:hypothetical protein
MNRTKVAITGRIQTDGNAVYSTKTLLGKQHTVLPATMMVEGSYYPFVETVETPASLHFSGYDLKQSVNTWNGRPVAVNHPDAQSTCNSPDTFNKQWIGYVFNARYDEDGKSLKADLWIDNDRGKAITNRVECGQQIDVSIGAFGDLTPPAKQVHTEVADYDFKMTNIVGDHLAVLPDGVGACSWKDGCGIRAAVYAKGTSNSNVKETKKEVNSMEECAEVKEAGVKEVSKAQPVAMSLDEALRQLPEDKREYVLNSMKNFEERRKSNIKKIVACSLVKFCEKDLSNVKDMSLLESIVSLVEAKHVEEKKEVETPAAVADYQLRASAGSVEQEATWAKPTDIVWDKTPWANAGGN